MTVAASFAFVLAMMLLGRLLAWRRITPPDTAAALNVVVLYVCLPAAILLHAPPLQFDAAIVKIAAVPWLTVAVVASLVAWLARLLRLGRSETAVLLMLTVLGNTSFLGFALIPALAGDAALRYAVVYDQFGSFLQLSTYGLLVLASHAEATRPTAIQILKRVLVFPPFAVLVIALTLMPDSYPPALTDVFQRLEGALLPLAALAIGMQLQLRLPREHLVPLALGLVLKLILLPALTLGLCLALGLSGDMLAATVLESAMPGMITAAALLGVAGLAPALAAATIGWGVIVSMATLPLWAWLLAHFYGST